VTPREKLDQLGDEFSESQVEVALKRRLTEREAVGQWMAAEGAEATAEAAWAWANARESVREEPW
jgi:hypothetical protein